jgi:2,4-dienoyl-CoA reductase-like NADH-dependent reductase (Old Yellow Enzyme family)
MGSKFEHVFAPIKIRGVDFKNRITLAPPSPNVNNQDGTVSRDFVDWMRPLARAAPQFFTWCNASIDITECHDEGLSVGHEHRQVHPALSWYAEMAAQYNCHASLEINHNGKDTAFETVGHPPYSASAIITSSEMMRAKRWGVRRFPPLK